MPSQKKTSDEPTLHPSILWAQRNDVIYLTICLDDCKNPSFDIKPELLEFSGNGGPEQKLYAVSMQLNKEIDTDKSKYIVRPRNIDVVLVKKETGPFWPRLTKEKMPPFIRTDFQRWKDEDESDYETGAGGGMGGMGGDYDLQSMMQQMGGLDGKHGYGDMDNDMPESEEEDDEEIPELGDAEDSKDHSHIIDSEKSQAHTKDLNKDEHDSHNAAAKDVTA